MSWTGEFIVNTPSDVSGVRDQIKGVIWQGGIVTTPSLTTYDGYTNDGDPVGYMGKVPTMTSWLVWRWPFGGGLYNMIARTWVATYPGSTNLLVYNAGHWQGFFAGNPYTPILVRDFIRRISNEMQCDVILSSMPLQGENRNSAAYFGWLQTDPVHDYLGTLPAHMPPDGSPLRYFVEPVIASIDYMLAAQSYDKIIMAGISGGGWTTTLLAAIDPRITHSYAIAGSVPFAYRAPGEGDWEQYAAVQALGVDYTDLYLMGTIDASGNPTRKVGLLYNGNDVCCFKGTAVHGFDWHLINHAKANGFGSLRIFVDGLQSAHDIHQSHSDAVMASLS